MADLQSVPGHRYRGDSCKQSWQNDQLIYSRLSKDGISSSGYTVSWAQFQHVF
jgi:hypothetical protein